MINIVKWAPCSQGSTRGRLDPRAQLLNFGFLSRSCGRDEAYGFLQWNLSSSPFLYLWTLIIFRLVRLKIGTFSSYARAPSVWSPIIIAFIMAAFFREHMPYLIPLLCNARNLCGVPRVDQHSLFRELKFAAPLPRFFSPVIGTIFCEALLFYFTVLIMLTS